MSKGHTTHEILGHEIWEHEAHCGALDWNEEGERRNCTCMLDEPTLLARRIHLFQAMSADQQRLAMLNEIQRLRHLLDLKAHQIKPQSDGREHHAALQRIGTALGLLAGSNLHTDCVPEIERLVAACRTAGLLPKPTAIVWAIQRNQSHGASQTVWWQRSKTDGHGLPGLWVTSLHEATFFNTLDEAKTSALYFQPRGYALTCHLLLPAVTDSGAVGATQSVVSNAGGPA